jgi:hypothetical protein
MVSAWCQHKNMVKIYHEDFILDLQHAIKNANLPMKRKESQFVPTAS